MHPNVVRSMVGGLVGTIMTIYGRVRARQPLGQRDVTIKV